jgi:hypothetical protein
MSRGPLADVRWRAGRDQIAHAFVRGSVRNLCGCPVVAERLAWPPTARCPDCVSLSGLRPVAA